MTDPLTAAAFRAAESLAPDLVKTGARWTGRRILSTPAERGMQSVYTRAIARLLAEPRSGSVYPCRVPRQGYEAAEAVCREALPLAQNWDEPDLLDDVMFNLAQLLYFYIGRHQDA